MRSSPKLFALMAVAVVAGSCWRAVDAPARPMVRFVTAAAASAQTSIGRQLEEEYARTLPQFEFRLIERLGSVLLVKAIQQGTADVGIAPAHVAYLAFTGKLDGSPQRFDRLRAISVLPPTALHLVVRRDAGIKQVGDLRGRKVNVGGADTGTPQMSMILLRAYGLGPSSIEAINSTAADAVADFASGRVDAMFLNANYPAQAIAAALAMNGRLLSLEGSKASALRIEYPFFRRTRLPAGVYASQSAPVHTIESDSLLICGEQLDEYVVYELTRHLFESVAAVSAFQAARPLMDFDNAPGTPIPLHNGAIRFYRERELNR